MDFGVVGVFATVAAIGFIAGWAVGRFGTDRSWVLSAREDHPEYRTAHHCGGKFYYVIPEPEFCRDWQPKPTEADDWFQTYCEGES